MQAGEARKKEVGSWLQRTIQSQTIPECSFILRLRLGFYLATFMGNVSVSEHVCTCVLDETEFVTESESLRQN